VDVASAAERIRQLGRASSSAELAGARLGEAASAIRGSRRCRGVDVRLLRVPADVLNGSCRANFELERAIDRVARERHAAHRQVIDRSSAGRPRRQARLRGLLTLAACRTRRIAAELAGVDVAIVGAPTDDLGLGPSRGSLRAARDPRGELSAGAASRCRASTRRRCSASSTSATRR
jgi:hypothetical protein